MARKYIQPLPLSFDGVKDQVVITGGSAPMVAATSDITIAVDVYLPVGFTNHRFFSRFHGEGTTCTPAFNYDSATNGYLFQIRGASSGSHQINSSIKTVQKWFTLMGTWNKTTGDYAFYMNGILIGSANIGAENSATGANRPAFMNTVDSGNTFTQGYLKNGRVWTRALSASEAVSYYFNKNNPNAIPRDSLAGEWLMQQSYQGQVTDTTVVADTSGNNVTGNAASGISAPMYVADPIPLYRTPVLGKNLVRNGNFELVPLFTAATTSNKKWIDGTATGTDTGTGANDAFQWLTVIDANTVSFTFDTAVFHSGGCSMRMDIADATGRGRIFQGTGVTGSATSVPLNNLYKYGFVALPSTSYDLSFWVKGLTLAASSTVAIAEYDGTGTRILNTNYGSVSGTFDWKNVAATFTTQPTTAFMSISVGMNSAGSAGSIWFDDIVLKQTTPTDRTASARRTRDRDFGTALQFAGDTGAVVIQNGSGQVYDNASDVTISFWAYPQLYKANSFMYALKASGGNNRKYVILNATGFFQANSGSVTTTSTTQAQLQTWQHVVMQFDYAASKFRLLVNNAVAIDWTSFTPGTGNAVINLGSFGSANQGFAGILDELVMWNRVLTDTELGNLTYEGLVPSSNLLGIWLLDEGSGTTPLDSSGRGNNGSITGAGAAYTGIVHATPRTLA